MRGGEVAAIAGNVGHGTRFVGCMDQTTDEQNTLYISSDTLKLRMRFWKRHAAKKTLHNAKKWGAALFLPRFFSRGILVMEILECVPTELFII